MKLSKFRELASSLFNLSILLCFLFTMNNDNSLKYIIMIIVTAISGIWFVYSTIFLFKQSKQ